MAVLIQCDACKRLYDAKSDAEMVHVEVSKLTNAVRIGAKIDDYDLCMDCYRKSKEIVADVNESHIE